MVRPSDVTNSCLKLFSQNFSWCFCLQLQFSLVFLSAVRNWVDWSWLMLASDFMVNVVFTGKSLSWHSELFIDGTGHTCHSQVSLLQVFYHRQIQLLRCLDVKARCFQPLWSDLFTGEGNLLQFGLKCSKLHSKHESSHLSPESKMVNYCLFPAGLMSVGCVVLVSWFWTARFHLLCVSLTVWLWAIRVLLFYFTSFPTAAF